MAAVASGSPGPLAQGLDLFKRGRFTQAEPLLKRGVETAAPDALQGLLALSQIYLMIEDYEQAIPTAERAVKLAPGSSAAHYLLAQSYGLKAINIARVRALFMAKDILREYKSAVSLDPKNIDARHGLVRFYLLAPSVAGGGVDKARAEAEAIVPIDPARGLLDVARVALEQGKDSEVLAALDRLQAIDGGAACLGRGFYYSKKKDVERAAAELLKVAEVEPRSPKTMIDAATQLQGLGRWDDALSLLGRVLKDAPDSMLAVYQVGRVCLLSKKDLPRAEAAFKRYLSAEPAPQSPSHAATHWRLGQVYQEMGRKEDARRELQEAVRLEPKNKAFRETLASVK